MRYTSMLWNWWICRTNSWLTEPIPSHWTCSFFASILKSKRTHQPLDIHMTNFKMRRRKTYRLSRNSNVQTCMDKRKIPLKSNLLFHPYLMFIELVRRACECVYRYLLFFPSLSLSDVRAIRHQRSFWVCVTTMTSISNACFFRCALFSVRTNFGVKTEKLNNCRRISNDIGCFHFGAEWALRSGNNTSEYLLFAFHIFYLQNSNPIVEY